MNGWGGGDNKKFFYIGGEENAARVTDMARNFRPHFNIVFSTDYIYRNLYCMW
jgi:hypothetical protein